MALACLHAGPTSPSSSLNSTGGHPLVSLSLSLSRLDRWSVPMWGAEHAVKMLRREEGGAHCGRGDGPRSVGGVWSTD